MNVSAKTSSSAGRAPRLVPENIRVALVDAACMIGVVVVIAAVAAIFTGVATQRVVAYAAIMLTMVCSLQIFSGNTGVVSFGHSGFVGIGAYAAGILTMPSALQNTALKQLPAFMAGYELPFFGALAVVLALAVLIGALSGTPLLRLSGSSASIATLALLIIIYTLLIAGREITRGSQPFYGVPREAGLWSAIGVACVSLLVARVFRDTAVGLAARAAANDERGAAATGVNRTGTWYLSWILSVVVAFSGGALLAQFLGAFSPKDFYFELSFTMLAMLIVGGMSSTLGAFAGVAVTTVVIEIVRRLEGGGNFLGFDMPPLFGLTHGVLALAMILIIWRRPLGLLGAGELNFLRRAGKSRAVPADGDDAAMPRVGKDLTIVTKDVSKRYAGVLAVDGISLEFKTDSITGIIGPNGAGKTTFLNLIAGEVLPTSGTVSIGQGTKGHSAYRFARAGIARTFQNIRVFGRMTVFENVLVAARQVETSLLASEASAWRELRLMGLEEHADRQAQEIAYGLRRRLEIARALALHPNFLLLDEPAAGMNTVETGELVNILTAVRAARGIGIILIEHDMRLVMNLCERIVVIDRGRVIADGQPEEVRNSPAVVEAYLGSRTARQQQQQNQISTIEHAKGE